MVKNNNSNKKNDDGNAWNQIFPILVGSLSGFTDGLNMSWTSPFIIKITQDKENYDINEEQASFFTTLQPLAIMIGCPIFSMLSDRIGRKKTLLMTGVLHILGWLLCIFANNVYLFYSYRICAGLGSSCFYAVFPIYIGEIANPSVRGSWGNALVSSSYFGQLTINIVGSYLGVKQTAYILLPIPLLFITLFSLMPESPYFYIMKKQEEQAKKSLQFLLKKKNVEKDYMDLKHDVDRQLSESGSWSDLFIIKSNRKAFLAGSFLRVTQQTSGLVIIVTFTQTIFQKSEGIINPELSSIVYCAVAVCFNLIVLVFIVHRFSRRMLFIVSLVLCGIVLYILASYFYIEGNLQLDLSSFKWVPITSLLCYQMFASFGLNVIPTLMMSELFSASIKAKAMSLLLIFMGAGNMIINTSFYYINDNLGFHASFYLYAVCNTIAAVIAVFLIPETKGKTLEEIQQILKK